GGRDCVGRRRLGTRGRAAAAGQSGDQAGLLGQDDERVLGCRGVGGEEVARDVVDARLHERHAAREAGVHERRHLVVEARVGGGVGGADLVADGEPARGRGRGRRGGGGR